MSDTFRETTSVSWLSRMKRSLGGFLIGVLLVLAMMVLLFWNEGRAVTTAQSLAEGASVVVSVSADAVDAANDRKLVHVTGAVTATAMPSDPEFGISLAGVRLTRSVEMYQWRQDQKSETRTKLGGGEETVTTYSYGKGWDDEAIDSDAFKQPNGHANPPMAIQSRRFEIAEARLGGFTLDAPVLARINDDRDLPLSPEQRAPIAAAHGGDRKISIIDGRIYLADRPTSPQVGDYRISYSHVPLETVSIIASQSGTGFEGYRTKAGNQLLMVRSGAVAAEQMFADAVSENTIITWLLRVVGLVVLAIAFAMVLAPAGVVADVVPLVGSIVRMGTGLVAVLLAVLVGGAVIAIAWFYYRPLLSFAILAATLAITAALSALARTRNNAPTPPQRPAAEPPAQRTPSTAAPDATEGQGVQPTIKW